MVKKLLTRIQILLREYIATEDAFVDPAEFEDEIERLFKQEVRSFVKAGCEHAASYITLTLPNCDARAYGGISNDARNEAIGESIKSSNAILTSAFS